MDAAKDQAPRVRQVPVCAIGASAGGVKALQQFFRGIRDDLGLAYVVIVHLSPEHESQLSEILAGRTRMPVRQVVDSPELEPNCVYVIPPDRELVIEDNAIRARPFSEPRGQRAPIDMFFRSIAAGRGDGMAVILSGAGSDGALGVRKVKEAGGVIFVQEPSEAEFGMMPRSAMATGVADFVEPIDRMVERIAEVARSKEALRRLGTDEADEDLRRILGFLRARIGHDFSAYKRATVMRRIARRMAVTRMLSLADYAIYLRETPEEAQNLFSDLLISVTAFFRDPAAFEAVAHEVFRPLIENRDDGQGGDRRGDDDKLRMWSVGCATGEEAYSLAILLLEEAERREVAPAIQIFATDLDDGALATAREGRYPKAIEADVSDARLRRFFVDEGTHYRIRKEVRDLVLFAHHSAVKDPPFMRLDLVTCRNLLIYLERDMQRQLLALFHYALNPGGCLFLGTAESVDTRPELFAPSNRDARLYAAKPRHDRGIDLLAALPRGHVAPLLKPVEDRARGRHAAGCAPDDARGAGAAERARRRGSPRRQPLGQRRALHPPLRGADDPGPARPGDERAPGRAAPRPLPGLRAPEGDADPAGPGRARRDRLPHRHACLAGGERRPRGPARARPVHGQRTGARGGGDAGWHPGWRRGRRATPADPDAERVNRLEEALRSTQDRLGASRREHENAIQELRVANEELQSINEEYRSTAEELETSKEELQSMNEELSTVNAELKIKLDTVASAHSDLQNLINATEIGTLFLDAKMRIRMLTPEVERLFSVTDSDVGRPITDFTHRLAYDGIEADAVRVLRTLEPTESEVATRDGRWLMMRLRPYRTVEDRIDGVVLSFVDITSRREAQQNLAESEARYRRLFEAMDEGYLRAEILRDAAEGEEAGEAVDLFCGDANPAAERLLGRAIGGRRLTEALPELEPVWGALAAEVAVRGAAIRTEIHAEELGRWFDVAVSPVEKDEVAIRFQDITERKRHADERELMVGELNHRVKNMLAVVKSIGQQTRRTTEDSAAFMEAFGQRLDALSTAHGLLTGNHWKGSDLAALAGVVLEGFAEGEESPVRIEGPAVRLSPNATISFTMALHELATNAIKYGALADPHGRVDLAWRLERVPDGARLDVVWEERDGPPVVAPARRGFGSRILEDGIAYELGGTAELDYRPTGLVYHLSLPVDGTLIDGER